MKTVSESSENREYKQMTEMPVGRLVLQLAFSTVPAMVFIAIYGLVDMICVSRLGDEAAGGVGVMTPVTALVQAVGYTYGMGAASLISRLLGEKKEKEAQNTAFCAVCFGALSGIIIMGAGLIFIKPLAAFLGSTKGAYSSALEYGRIVFISTPVVILVYVLESIIRAEGKTLLVFWAILGGGIVNIILDFVLIFGRHMGVKGCALASALGQTLAVIIMLIPYISGKTILSPKRLSIGKSLFSFPVIVKTGLPSFLRQGLVCVAGILLNRSCSRYGDGALAGISAANRIFTIFFSAAVGYGQALAPVIGYNYGAKKNERVRKSYIFAQITGAAFMVFCGAALYFFSDFVAGWFFPQGETKSAAVMALKADCFSFPFIACFVMTGVLYQSVGRVGRASLIYSLRQGIFFIPLIYILPYFLGFRGIIWASPGADMLAGVVSVILTLRIYFDIL